MMTTVDNTDQITVLPETEQFLAGAYRRILGVTLALGGIGSIPVFYQFGWKVGAGFLVGVAIAYINFLWLKSSILALTDRIAAESSLPDAPAREDSKPERRTVIFKFLFRYAAIGAVAYAIISSSSINVYGLIGGVLLSVLALLTEAVCELVFLLRHGG